VLRAHLLDEQPDRVPELHRRASEWYEQNGERFEAIRHAMAGADTARAADLVELAFPAMRQGRLEAALLVWLRALPDEVIRRRPVLSVGYAWALVASGDFGEAEGHLQDAERCLGQVAELPDGPEAASAGVVVVNEDEFRFLPATIAIYRAVLSQFRGDVPATVRHAQRALDLSAEDDDLRRGAAGALLGLASWANGDLETAHRIYAEGMARVQRAGNLTDAVGAAIALADIRIAQGRLRDAMRTYEQALRLATGPTSTPLRATADIHVGISDILREQGDLQAARQHLLTSKELGEHNGFPQNRYRWYVVTARIREGEGDLDGALDSLDEAERLYVPDFNPDVRPLSALKARVWARSGKLADAIGWARERGLSAGDDLSYLREFEHVTFARVLLAQGMRKRPESSSREAIELLGRLLRAADEGQRTGSVIEILVLQALAQHMHGDIPAALAPLERAVTLAEPEGFIRMFVDEGPPMAVILEAAAKRGVAPRYVRELLTAFRRGGDRTPSKQALIEPLSERELDVLQLLATDLDGPAIASQLVVSLSTIRSHTKSIYAKLGVNSRRAAVRRGEELDLMSRVDRQPRPIIVHDS
jgi:LuxR family maltose regulon positive regulatory protein